MSPNREREQASNQIIISSVVIAIVILVSLFVIANIDFDSKPISMENAAGIVAIAIGIMYFFYYRWFFKKSARLNPNQSTQEAKDKMQNAGISIAKIILIVVAFIYVAKFILFNEKISFIKDVPFVIKMILIVFLMVVGGFFILKKSAPIMLQANYSKVFGDPKLRILWWIFGVATFFYIMLKFFPPSFLSPVELYKLEILVTIVGVGVWVIFAINMWLIRSN